MKRWNGWGEESVKYHLAGSAAGFIEKQVGLGQSPTDCTLEEVVAQVPPSRLPPHPLVTTGALERVRHARGQSFPDWVALRSGQGLTFPDGVAYPYKGEEVAQLIQYARENGVKLIPYGGGTSVVGHINPPQSDAPVLTVDLGRMNRLQRLAEDSQLATFGAGVAGPDLEAQLRAKGYTLGHYPQSFEYSTLGGWVATRSSGQQSLGYGRIERLFAGGRLESPAGTLELAPFPASAAGPDLREWVLGSEGRMGVITEATVRVTRLPEEEHFHAVFFPDWERGMQATREIIQAGLPMSLLRYSTPTETETTLKLAGHRQVIAALEKVLEIRGAGAGKCMLLLGFTGRKKIVAASRKEALSIARKHKGVHLGQMFGKEWHKSRFRTPYLRNSLWDKGYAVDTLETAITWEKVPGLVTGVEKALREAMEATGEKIHVFTHLSHLYPSGSSAYTTYLFRLAPDPQETLRRWKSLKEAASNFIVAQGGTISHQHGVGTDHAPYLQAEKGALGMEAIGAVLKQFDPAGMMNPGKLIEGWT